MTSQSEEKPESTYSGPGLEASPSVDSYCELGVIFTCGRSDHFVRFLANWKNRVVS